MFFVFFAKKGWLCEEKFVNLSQNQIFDLQLPNLLTYGCYYFRYPNLFALHPDDGPEDVRLEERVNHSRRNNPIGIVRCPGYGHRP